MSDRQFEQQRQEEQDAAQERVVNEAFAERDDAPTSDEGAAQAAHEGPAEGRRGDEPLQLDENLQAAFEAREQHEPNPEVAQALEDIRNIPVREAIEEADN